MGVSMCGALVCGVLGFGGRFLLGALLVFSLGSGRVLDGESVAAVWKGLKFEV